MLVKCTDLSHTKPSTTPPTQGRTPSSSSTTTTTAGCSSFVIGTSPRRGPRRLHEERSHSSIYSFSSATLNHVLSFMSPFSKNHIQALRATEKIDSVKLWAVVNCAALLVRNDPLVEIKRQWKTASCMTLQKYQMCSYQFLRSGDGEDAVANGGDGEETTWGGLISQKFNWT